MTTPNDDLAGALGALATKTNPEAAQKNATTAERELALATGYTIATAEEYKFAAEDLRRIMERSAAMEAERTVFTGPLNQVLKAFNARFMPHIQTLDKAAALIKQKMGAFTAEQERLARIERERAEAAAAAERKRIEDLATAERKRAADAAEAAAKAERERQAAAAAAQRKLDEEAAAAKGAKARREAEARAEAQRIENERLAAEQRERDEAARLDAERKAQALETTAAMVVAQPSTAMAVTQASGITTRTLVDYEITDPAAFVGWIMASRPDLIELITFDAVKVRAFTKLAGLKTTAPGLRVFPKSSVAVR